MWWVASRAFGASPGRLAGALAVSLVQALLPALQVISVRLLLEALAAGDRRLVWWWALAVAVAAGLSLPLGQVGTAVSKVYANGFLLALDRSLLDALSRLEPRAHSSGEVQRRLELARDATEPVSRMPMAIFGLFSTLITAGSLLWALWSSSPIGAVAVLLSLAPPFLALRRVSRINVQGWPRYARHNARAEYLRNLLALPASGQDLLALGSAPKVADEAGESRSQAVRVNDAMVLSTARVEASSGLVSGLMLLVGLLLIVAGSTPAPATAAAVVGAISAMGAMRFVGVSIGQLLTTLPRVGAIRSLVDEPDTSQAAAATPLADALLLDIDDAGFTYPGPGGFSLHDITLQLAPGDRIAIAGLNGAGKTTLAKLVTGVLTPQNGHIRVAGHDTTTEHNLSALVSTMPQEFGHYELTVRGALNLAASKPEVSEQAMWDVLQAVGLAGLVASWEQGLDQQLGIRWDGVDLSTGQWQRLALARTMLRDTPLAVLDEPTSAVDAESEEAIFTAIQHWAADRALILISHRAWTMRWVDRILVMEDGRIVEQGTFAELTSRSSRFAEIFHTQLFGE